METIIIATKNCNHQPLLAQQLDNLSVQYSIKYVEENPDLALRYDIQHSPNLVVNGDVVFRAGAGKSLPTPAELRAIFQK